MFDASTARYLRRHGVRETPLMRANREATARTGRGHLQIEPEQGQLMALCLLMIGARRGIEIGVYAGYSALWLAGALAPDGRLLACDIDPEITERARRDWAAAGLAGRIDLRIAPALETLAAEREAGREGAYDFVLIDADKSGYIEYYEHAQALVRAGGLIMADNTLWYGRVTDEADDSVDTRAIRAFNAHLAADARIDLCLLPVGDGLTVARKR